MREATSGYIAFRPRARLLKLIGAELISDEVVAVTELVKNAHDADASTVEITFRGVTGDRGEIIITDDGCGMDVEALLGRWMEPAGSGKAVASGRLTPRGRRALGEKGVGRFAADKLGRTLELISRRAGHKAEVRAVFDWDDFDTDARMLSEVKSRWELRPARAISGQGTILRISGLRETWNERMFRKLSTRLSRLQSPFSHVEGFRIAVESEEFPEYSREVQNGFLDRAPYRIEMTFDGKDRVDVLLDGQRSRFPISASLGALRCGPVRVRLHAFDLETDAIAAIGPRHEVRAWLREWSGVSVYRDGFRVWPYGEPHDDWLRLDQRRVNNPVVKLSNNQVVGFVEISRDRNPDLLDQTSREGLIHNSALGDLKRFVEHAFQLLEAERQRIRHPRDRRSARRRLAESVDDSIVAQLQSAASEQGPAARKKIDRVIEELKARAVQHEGDRRKLVQGYSDLAAFGQAAMGLGERVDPLVCQLRSQSARLSMALKDRKAGELSRAVRSIQSTMAAMDRQLSMVTALEAGGSHRRRTMDVQAEIQAFGQLFAPILQARGVEFVVRGAAIQRVDMNPQSFARVLSMLATNSLEWFIGTGRPRIEVTCRGRGEMCEILFRDNGAGINRKLAGKIFEPLFSLKEGGRGMGLTIARDLIELHGGTICAVVDGRRNGAAIRILLPRKRSRATPRA